MGRGFSQKQQQYLSGQEGRGHLTIFEDLQIVSATGERGAKWGVLMGKAREEAEARGSSRTTLGSPGLLHHRAICKRTNELGSN